MCVVSHREHEWLEHGTCATGISSMSTVYGYFSTVLSLFEDKHNYTNVLERHGIKPSQTKTYDVSVVILSACTHASYFNH